MMSPQVIYDCFIDLGVGFFAGVPDSLLKHLCSCISHNTKEQGHIIAANEGAAVGLAMGYHLATGGVPLVYFQNSGLGNTINPLLSLADERVYSIPMLLVVGWRGEPGVADEPQHVKQGEVTLPMLECVGVESFLLDEDMSNKEGCDVLRKAMEVAQSGQKPVAIVVRKGAFEKYHPEESENTGFPLTREQAINTIIQRLGDRDAVVSTTGMASRELYELRDEMGVSHSADFLTVGGMGHASQIALGIALHKPDRNVICIDGDGAAIMHMGSLAINGNSGAKNFRHIVINNGAHDSVGGQPTVALKTDFSAISEACGYKKSYRCDDLDSLEKHLGVFLREPGPIYLEVRVTKGNRPDLGRPKTSPDDNKKNFMSFLNK